ncbi:MAG: tetratricopeptide repeat protein [Phycisphaerales bacterium]
MSGVVALLLVLLTGGVGYGRDMPDYLPNGRFERVDDKGWPVGWTTKHEKHVKWVMAEGEPFKVSSRVAQMSGDEGLMGTYGVDVLSDKVEIKPGHRYRVTGWARSGGPNQIVFVKGFGTVTRKIEGRETRVDEVVYQMKKEITPSREWTRFSLEFEIKPAKIFTAHQAEVTYVRVLLWAYWPVGTCWYGDVHFFDVTPADEKITAEHSPTFTGEKPRLSEEADRPAEEAFDAEQAWMDAGNAWGEGAYAKCAAVCGQLIAHEPGHVNGHLMLARTLVTLERWNEAWEQVTWLQSQDAGKLAAWQSDYAKVTRGEILLHEGKKEEAKALMQAVIAHSESAGAAAAAKEVLEKIEKPGSAK